MKRILLFICVFGIIALSGIATQTVSAQSSNQVSGGEFVDVGNGILFNYTTYESKDTKGSGLFFNPATGQVINSQGTAMTQEAIQELRANLPQQSSNVSTQTTPPAVTVDNLPLVEQGQVSNAQVSQNDNLTYQGDGIYINERGVYTDANGYELNSQQESDIRSGKYDTVYNNNDYVPETIEPSSATVPAVGTSPGISGAGSIPLGDKQTGSTPALGDKIGATQKQQTQFLQNPLKGVTSISDLVKELVNLFTTILWIIAAIMLLWSGFMYIKAQGDPDAIAEAHARFKNVLIGIAIIVGANTISSVIQELVRSLNN